MKTHIYLVLIDGDTASRHRSPERAHQRAVRLRKLLRNSGSRVTVERYVMGTAKGMNK